MTFDASKFGVQERQLSDVEAVQAPVQDNSKAMAMSGIAQSVGDFVGSAFSIKEGYQKQEAAAARTRFGNEYDSAIEKYSGAVSSGEMTRLQADTYLGQVKADLVTQGASADDLNKTEIAALKTLSGRALLEGSAEERAEKKAEEIYNNSNYFNPYHSEEEKEAAKAKLFSDMNQKAADDSEIDRLSLEAKRYEKGTNDYKKAQRNLKEKQIGILNTALTGAPALVSNEQATIVAQYESDKVEFGEAQARLNAENSWNTFKNPLIRSAELAANKIEGGLPVQKAAYIDMLERRSGFLDGLGDANLVKKMREVEAEEQAKLQIALLNQEHTRVSKVVTDTWGPQSLVYFDQMNSKAATSLNNFNVEAMTRDEGDEVVSLGRDKESLEEARKVLELNVSDFLEGKHEGDPKNLDKLVSAHLARVSQDFKTLSDKEIDKSLKYYASPEFGRYVKQRGLSGKDLDNVNRQMQNHKYKVANSFVNLTKEALGAEKKRARLSSTGARGKLAAANVAGVEDFDLVFEGGQVRMKPLHERAREEVEAVNEKIVGPLTRIVRADANFSGQSQEKVFNAWKEQLWPDEEPAQGEAKPEAIDYSQYEDGPYRDPETGGVMFIRNGTRLKGGE
jgi:hypothetical protein